MKLRKLTLTNLDWLAIGLIGLGGVAVIVGATTAELDAWMPNVATSAWSIAATIAIVERIVRREAARRIQPRVDAAMESIRQAVQWLVVAIADDYIETHVANYQEVPDDFSSVIELWLSEVGQVDTARRPFNEKPALIVWTGSTARWLEGVRRYDSDVINPELLVAVNELARELQSIEWRYDLIHLIKGDTDPLLRSVVESAKSFAAVYAPQPDADTAIDESGRAAIRGARMVAVEKAEFERDKS